MEYKSTIDVDLISFIGNDTQIAAAAWVSTQIDSIRKAQDEPEAVKGLINYLIRHRHGTPFEHNSLTFLIKAPIFVWREWHRHRIGFSYNEQSGRYMVLQPVFYIPTIDRPMIKVDNWKAGRPKFDLSSTNVYDQLVNNLKSSYDLAYHCYLENLALGVDPGLARDCLPVGIYSSCYVTCNIRSLMAFLSLRTSDNGKSYPLYEIEMAAKQCEEHFKQLFPVTYDAFVDNGRMG